MSADIPSPGSEVLRPSSNARLESSAFCIFLITIILAPLAFWPSPYIALDLTKTFIIALGTLISAILYGLIAIKEKKVTLPPRSMLWTSKLIALSLVISSLTSIHVAKSFFGQGFELDTASFILLLFVSALVAYTVTVRKSGRVVILYAGMTASFLVLYVLHLLRFIFGSNFASFSILNSMTSTVLGRWQDMGIYGVVVALISLTAISFFDLSRRMKIVCWVLVGLSALGAFVVGDQHTWMITALVCLGLTIYFSFLQPKSNASSRFSWTSRIAWIPLIACAIALLFTWKGTIWAGKLAPRIGSVSELSLPWQMTLDVNAGAIKNYPIFGVGPNHFGQAFLAYKPLAINATDAWNIEFNYGFSLLSTFIATQGIVGTILWLLFLVLFAVNGARVLRRLPDDPFKKFAVVSSFTSAVFLWLMTAVSVPQHALLLYAFVMTGIFFGCSVAYDRLVPYVYSPAIGSRMYKFMPALLSLLVVVAALWGIIYVKKTTALAYFGSGVKQLTVTNNADMAYADFKKASALDASDVYLQARVEAGLAKANTLAGSVGAGATASSTQVVVTQIVATINTAIADARSAIAYDPSNYYNHLSEARVSEVATNLHIDKGYETAVQSYINAISVNRFNPSLYLGLARLQASQSKFDDSLKSIGAALQVKNNYLDAIFLLSQVQAAKGNLTDAIVAAQVATQINPQNALLYFQLGLLQYNAKSYDAAAQALTTATTLQSDYANAKYFLGLSYARLGKNTEAIKQFQELATANPDNKELVLILTNLRSGKSIFADAQPPITANPEKRQSLPVSEPLTGKKN